MIEKYKKYIIKSFLFTILLSGFCSCETTELGILEDPNALTPEQADIDLFLNSVQIQLSNVFNGNQTDANRGFSETGMEITRILHMFGPTYVNGYAPSDNNFLWEDVFAELLIDARTMIPLAEEQGLYTHVGIAKVIEAYTVMTLVDYFGDIPYSETLQGAGNLNPALDNDEDIYAALGILLDEAINDFEKEESSLPGIDFYFGGDEDKWIRLAKTLKLKMYVQTYLVDGTAADKINSLIDEGDLILTEADDFQFNYSSVNTNPDSRHPWFGRNFDAAGSVVDYMSNSYMVLIKDDYVAGDPRLRYYFYRQSLDFAQNVNQNECIEAPRPPHYGLTDVWCNPGDGYWGRDHHDADGIPLDANLRSTWGVYPVGGLFDFNQGESVSGNTIGLQGAGIAPIMLSSYVNFMLAESSLAIGTNGDARTYLETGIRQSLNKVIDFGSASPELSEVFIEDDPATPDVDETQTVEQVFGADEQDVNNYIAAVLDRYDAASTEGKEEIVVIEYFKALYGNGVEAYNTYRRTGYPSNLQPSLEADPGMFVNSLFYPDNLASQNSSVDQKTDQTDRVFWAEGGPTVD